MELPSTNIAAIRNVAPMRHIELDSLQMNRMSEIRSRVDRNRGNIMA